MLISESNQREHWAKRHRRRKSQRADVRKIAAAWLKRPALPCEIVITRIAPCRLDVGDNLEASAKAIRDWLADWLAINDRDERIKWTVLQERRAPRVYGLRIEVRRAAA
jgi:hypothetical protein